MSSRSKYLDANFFHNPFKSHQTPSDQNVQSTTRLFFKVNKQNFKEYTKSSLTTSPRKQTAKKHICFSSLENPPHRINLNSPCSFVDSTIEPVKSPRSGHSSLQYSQYNNYPGTSLPGFFVDERDASISCKEEIHDKIIEFGENIHETMVQNIRKEFEKIYKQREIEIIKKIEHEKQMEIENERLTFTTKLEQLKSQLKIEYERRAKDKITESQVLNTNLANEQIEEYKIQLRKELEESVQEMREQFENDRRHLIEKGMKKEREKINHKIDDERKIFDQKIKETNEQWNVKIEQNSVEITKKLHDEFRQKLDVLNEQHKRDKQNELDEQKCFYENKILTLSKQIEIKQFEIDDLKDKIIRLNRENDRIQNEMDKIKVEYQNCINRFAQLKDEESDFLYAFNEFTTSQKKIRNFQF